MIKNFITFFVIFCFGIINSQTKKDLMQISKINDYINTIETSKEIKRNSFIISRKDKVKINYEYFVVSGEIVKISRKWSEIKNGWIETNIDEFILKNNKNIFAFQSITNENKNNINDFITWNCKFWLYKNKVIDMISLGHGKTEDDNWNYEKEIQNNFNYMIKTIKKHLTKNKK